MTHDPPTCWTLLREVVAGDTVARERFARSYEPVVRSYLAARWRGTTRLPQLDDAVQDLFVECFRTGGILTKIDEGHAGGFRAFAMSDVGSASHTTRSAARPASSSPRSPSRPIARAATIVADAKTSAAGIPDACNASISRYTLGPGAVPGFPASVPTAIGMPAVRMRRTFRSVAWKMLSNTPRCIRARRFARSESGIAISRCDRVTRSTQSSG